MRLELTVAVNTATRSPHARLNRLIIQRLPLALPPNTTNPSTFVSGLLHIAPIYITFESLWQSILDAPQLPVNLLQSFPFEKSEPAAPNPIYPISKAIPLLTPPDTPQPGPRKVYPRIQNVLSHLQIPGLPRADRLRQDIRILTGTRSQEVEIQLAAVANQGRLADFIAHTKMSVDANPHVLVAYAFVLYMAMFAGGRQLRMVLKKAGGEGQKFWDRDPSPVRPYSITQEDTTRRRSSRSDYSDTKGKEAPPRASSRSRARTEARAAEITPGMQFFNFAGDADGEDIKKLFKARITKAEILLSDGEKEDIVKEAVHIFDFMILLVGDLDAVMGTQDSELATDFLLQKPLLLSSRDSVSVTRDRIEKTKTNGIDIDNDRRSRKPSFLEVLVSGPVATLVQFKGSFTTFDFVRPLSRHLTGDSIVCPASGVTFTGSDVNIPHPMPQSDWYDHEIGRYMLVIGPILVLVLGWCIYEIGVVMA